MKYRIKPDDDSSGMLHALMEKAAGEVFKWLGWVTAIAAVEVVAGRTDSLSLGFLAIFLCGLVTMHVQWFFVQILFETTDPNRGGVPKFKLWMVVFSLGTLLVYGLAIGGSILIAKSGLLPPQPQAQGSTVVSQSARGVPPVQVVLPTQLPAAQPTQVMKPK